MSGDICGPTLSLAQSSLPLKRNNLSVCLFDLALSLIRILRSVDTVNATANRNKCVKLKHNHSCKLDGIFSFNEHLL